MNAIPAPAFQMLMQRLSETMSESDWAEIRHRLPEAA